MRVKWYGKQVEMRVHKQAAEYLEKIALTVEAESKRLAPVRTGRLRASITHEVNEAELLARIGSDVSYAIYQELGTSKMAAHPFLRPALDSARQKSK